MAKNKDQVAVNHCFSLKMVYDHFWPLHCAINIYLIIYDKFKGEKKSISTLNSSFLPIKMQEIMERVIPAGFSSSTQHTPLQTVEIGRKLLGFCFHKARVISLSIQISV